MRVRTLAIRLMILALTLASALWPKAGSYDDGERLTAERGQRRPPAGGEVGRTAREEAVLGQDGDGVDEKDRDWRGLLARGTGREARAKRAVEEAPDEQHLDGGAAAAAAAVSVVFGVVVEAVRSGKEQRRGFAGG